MGEKDTYKKLFVLTLFIVLLLVLIIAYIFLIKPAIQGYVINKQIEASDFIVGSIINQIQQQGYVQLNYGEQSMILVPYIPPQGEQINQIQQSEQPLV